MLISKIPVICLHTTWHGCEVADLAPPCIAQLFCVHLEATMRQTLGSTKQCLELLCFQHAFDPMLCKKETSDTYS